MLLLPDRSIKTLKNSLSDVKTVYIKYRYVFSGIEQASNVFKK